MKKTTDGYNNAAGDKGKGNIVTILLHATGTSLDAARPMTYYQNVVIIYA